MRYIVKKKLNNNVVLIKDFLGDEKILIGDGIGFNAKINTPFNMYKKVKQIFVLSDKVNVDNFRKIVDSVDNELVALVEEDIDKIQNSLGTHLNENIHVTLIDHIAFMLDRHEKGLNFKNPFNEEIGILYENEYKQAKALVRKIEIKYDICIPEAEIGIIAIHIHAASNNEDINLSRKKAYLIQETIQSIYSEFELEINKKSLSYQRLLVHVCYAFERILSNQIVENDFMDFIIENYNNYFIRIERIMNEIASKECIKVPKSEICYLVLHFIRIKKEFH